MALLQLNFASRVLAQPADVLVLLPERDAQFVSAESSAVPCERPLYRTLFLLHGLGDDRMGWLRYTALENFVRGTNVAVIMPSASHGFYADMVHGHPYFTYVSQELPRYLASILPLSLAREDTYVMGNSMGGYGAFKLALTYPERFSRAVALSGALDIDHFVRTFSQPGFDPRLVFGEYLAVKGTSHDLFHLLDRALTRRAELPRFYSTCGVDDILIDESRSFAAYAQEHGVDYTYVEGEGAHLWTTWAENVAPAMSWLLAEQ